MATNHEERALHATLVDIGDIIQDDQDQRLCQETATLL